MYIEYYRYFIVRWARKSPENQRFYYPGAKNPNPVYASIVSR